MQQILLNAVVLLMVGANFACLYVVIGTWLAEKLPPGPVSQRSISVVVFAAAITVTCWGLYNYHSGSSFAGQQDRPQPAGPAWQSGAASD